VARAERAGVPLVDSYGLTETWGGVVLDGVPVEGAEIRLGDDSEVLIRGPMVMRGYRRRDDETTRALTHDGWLHTGDVGSWDPDGSLRVVDRARDLIISGGVNVSPSAVEAALAEHPDIADIAVAGAPDAEWGERVVAFVVVTDPGRAPTIDELRAFGRDRLGAAQLPQEVVVVDEIPRTPGGKARRRDLRITA
jgi:O-succinylbenzoic acid--CoA ligase